MLEWLVLAKNSTSYIHEKSQMLVHESLHWLGSHTMPKHGMLHNPMGLLRVWNVAKINLHEKFCSLKNFTKDKRIISSHFEWNGLVVIVIVKALKNWWRHGMWGKGAKKVDILFLGVLKIKNFFINCLLFFHISMFLYFL